MLDHQDQISISTRAARGHVYISSVVSHLLDYDDVDVMDNDIVATAMSAQIKISVALIGTVRKHQ